MIELNACVCRGDLGKEGGQERLGEFPLGGFLIHWAAISCFCSNLFTLFCMNLTISF